MFNTCLKFVLFFQLTLISQMSLIWTYIIIYCSNLCKRGLQQRIGCIYSTVRENIQQKVNICTNELNYWSNLAFHWHTNFLRVTCMLICWKPFKNYSILFFLLKAELQSDIRFCTGSLHLFSGRSCFKCFSTWRKDPVWRASETSR